MNGKNNCWDVMACGRGPGSREPVCPAAADPRLNGVHGGVNGGRACWAVAGTLCSGMPVTGTFAKRMETCFDCRFYRMVKEEEPKFQDHWDLLHKTR